MIEPGASFRSIQDIRGSFELSESVVLQAVLFGAIDHAQALRHRSTKGVDVGIVHEGAWELRVGRTLGRRNRHFLSFTWETWEASLPPVLWIVYPSQGSSRAVSFRLGRTGVGGCQECPVVASEVRLERWRP